MGSLSLLHNVCNKIRVSSLAECSSYKPYHDIVEGFQDALLQGCYFCFTMWRSLREIHEKRGQEMIQLGIPAPTKSNMKGSSGSASST
ncbi:hypothetical protein M3J09_006033 [Ascochyta lentis]